MSSQRSENHRLRSSQNARQRRQAQVGHRAGHRVAVGIQAELVVDLARRVAHVDARDAPRYEHSRHLGPDRGERVVHRLERCLPATGVEVVGDVGRQVGEHLVPHLDHRIRRRRHDQVDGLVRDGGHAPGVTDVDAVARLEGVPGHRTDGRSGA
jgi:hypothetical protein